MTPKLDQILNYDSSIEAKRRAFTGAYYTPLTIAQLMIEDAVCFYLQKKCYSFAAIDSFMAAENCDSALEMLTLLSDVNFIDMACGTGVFGFAWLAKLLELHRAYNLQEPRQFMQKVMRGMVLNDSNAESAEQFSILVKDQFGLDYEGSILTVDALLQLSDAPAVKAVLANGGFDIVIGNPPYVGEKGHGDLFRALKSHCKWQKYYMGKMDYSYFFIHQGLDILSKQGVMVQIMTSYFCTADGAAKLRADLQRRASWKSIRYYDKLRAFRGVSNLSFIIFSLARREQGASPCQVQRNRQKFFVSNDDLYGKCGQIQLIPPRHRALLDSIERNSCHKLSDVCNVNQGIVSGADRLKRKHCKTLGVPYRGERPIFVFKAGECSADPDLKPFLKNSDIGRYRLVKELSHYILYSARGKLASRQKWLQHLKPYRPLLARRREVKKGVRDWFELQWPRAEKIFIGKKIVAPQRSATNTFAYVEQPAYGSADIYYITLKQNSLYATIEEGVLLKALTMYLNGNRVKLWLTYKGKRKGAQFELYASPLKEIPLPSFSERHIKALAACYQSYLEGDCESAIARSEQIVNSYLE